MSDPVIAGYCKYFTEACQNPAQWDYSEQIYRPARITDTGNGVLYEFETELTAVLQVIFRNGRCRPITVFCGESMEEALDLEHCYYSWQPDPETGKTPCSALRFAFIPECTPVELDLYAIHQYVDIPVRAEFHCDDELLNRIWSVAEHTFRLCSGIFFIDGVKRDKWIWSGDAYQSLFVNQYLMADPDINRRTLLALRGNDPMVTHINTILDYSLFWILGVKAHYDAYADTTFIQQVYPKMCSLMEFCEKHLWNGILAGMKKCAQEGKIPYSIGIDTWAVDYVLLDKKGKMIGDAVAYRDKRTDGMDDLVEHTITAWDLYVRTGIQKQSFNTIYQLMALKGEHPEQLDNAEFLLMIPDYLHYLLTGVKIQEYTNATSTGMVNAHTNQWDHELIRMLGFPEKLFVDLSMPGTTVGELLPEIQKAVGFQSKVVLPATHDTGSAFLAVPAQDETAIYLSSGTWSLRGVENKMPVTTEASRIQNFTNEGGA